MIAVLNTSCGIVILIEASIKAHPVVVLNTRTELALLLKPA